MSYLSHDDLAPRLLVTVEVATLIAAMLAAVAGLLSAALAAVASLRVAGLSERRRLQERREEVYVELLGAVAEHERQIEQAVAEQGPPPQPSARYDAAFARAMLHRTADTKTLLYELATAAWRYRQAAGEFVATTGDRVPESTKEQVVEARHNELRDVWSTVVDAAGAQIRPDAGLSRRGRARASP